MKKVKELLRRFFFPPEGSPTWVKVLPYAVLGVLTLVALTGFAYTWEYTNSPQFCGESCHTMPPEYSSYLVSPHARVACVDCHIGKGFIAERITRKAGDIRHVIATLFTTYEFPIRVKTLRPARETCEKCHSPDKFSDDSLREIKRFLPDEANTPQTTYLALKTGGGSSRLGLGRGIHWHIENPIYYLPTDSEEQEIPYVKVMNPDGGATEYIALDSEIDPATIDPAQLKEMDCITCHNRITHRVLPPEDAVDSLISQNLISPAIPEIRAKAVELYSRPYSSVDEGQQGIAGLKNYYQVYYPDFYKDNASLVDAAISVLQESYSGASYPEQNSNWDTHPNNVGHKDSPGCFRCHDGKHLNQDQQAIRLECNLCHSIPVVSGPNDYLAKFEVSRGPEPQSHRNANWISQHHLAFDQTCSRCHTTENTGGTENTSFCSNRACHGQSWPEAGFDAPGLREIILAQLPPTPTPAPIPTGGALTYTDTLGPLLQARCGQCHGGANPVAGFNLTSYARLMQGGQSGTVITSGDAQNSLIYQIITTTPPHFAQLSPQELELLSQWILAEAPEK
jgi:nitrate/TMAO reductase-like tetraheme cytochrome c subunit